MTERPAPPPEGVLISTAIKRLNLSQRKAAQLAGMSEGRWRQIVQGFQTVSGTHIPVRGPADTVARMAQVARLTPEQLASEGREDAADELRRMGAGASTDPAEQDVHLRRLLELWPQARDWQRRSIVGVFEEMLSESPETSGKPGQADERRTG